MKAEELSISYFKWCCRRGMRELDVILNRFIDRCYDKLSDTELQQFNQLLEHQDTELWYWLSGKSQPKDLELKKIVKKINAASYHKKP